MAQGWGRGATLSVAKQFTSGIVFNDFLKAVNCMVNSSLWTPSTLQTHSAPVVCGVIRSGRLLARRNEDAVCLGRRLPITFFFFFLCIAKADCVCVDARTDDFTFSA